MKTKLVAIPPKGQFLDLTPGKEYDMLNIGGLKKNKPSGRYFNVRDNAGFLVFTREFKSYQLNGKNWIVKNGKV